MVIVVGVDPGTVSIDVCGLADGKVCIDRTFPTREALADSAAFLALLTEAGTPDLIAGPSGYGLPLIPARDATDADLRLAFLAGRDEAGGIGGLRRLARIMAESELPVVFTPGVIHLPTVPSHRKLNRVDLGTADKVAAAALGAWFLGRGAPPGHRPSFLLLELGGAFSAALAVAEGAIVDGLGGSSGPPGWKAAGGWDGEVAYLADRVTKEMLFTGGRESLPGDAGLEAYLEGMQKAALQLLVSVPAPEAILLSGRHARDAGIREQLEARLGRIAPVRLLEGFAAVAKEGAQGAALIADGLVGGTHRGLVEALRLREARGTLLDHLTVISPAEALRRLGA